MFEQLSLFELNPDDNTKCFHQNIQESGFDYQEVDLGDVTFKAGQVEPVHRWYRLTPSYSPSLVRFLIAEFQIEQGHFVIDPFSGRGTTSIECQKHGIQALGIEINPLLQQVGDRSLQWDTQNLFLIEKYLAEIASTIETSKNKPLENVVESLSTRLPIIYNVFRWWKPRILKDLIICREILLKRKYQPVNSYLWLALNKACLDCANIHRNHPTITFDDNCNRSIDVYSEMANNLKTICDDLKSLSKEEISFSALNSIKLGNSTRAFKRMLDRSVDFVITSPPYPNRYSYIHQTRPQLHFMEILNDVKQATEIDLQAIGGTWGRATSILQNQLIVVPSTIKPYLCYHEELKERSLLMCNYATKYFIDVWNHIRALKEVKSKKFRGAYVVGNSRLSGVEIFTEVILSKIFEHEDFKIEKIVKFRKRGGKKRLYETAIFIKS
ncbi:MAG: site-specific DNA-methyltransferase [Cyanobacteriota bacterium]|nr:site-specific DNA-methyltransferase [Cyanobacteriota bacterium]